MLPLITTHFLPSSSPHIITTTLTTLPFITRTKSTTITTFITTLTTTHVHPIPSPHHHHHHHTPPSPPDTRLVTWSCLTSPLGSRKHWGWILRTVNPPRHPHNPTRYHNPSCKMVRRGRDSEVEGGRG